MSLITNALQRKTMPEIKRPRIRIEKPQSFTFSRPAEKLPELGTFFKLLIVASYLLSALSLVFFASSH